MKSMYVCMYALRNCMCSPVISQLPLTFLHAVAPNTKRGCQSLLILTRSHSALSVHALAVHTYPIEAVKIDNSGGFKS